MKLIALALLLAPLQIAAQTDAMPPATQAPAQQGDMSGMHTDVKPAVKESKFLSVTFRGVTTTLTLADLVKLPQTTLHVRDGHTNKDLTFTGPLVSDVLARAGLTPTDDNHQLILHSTVVATGADGYYVVYSGAELEQMFSGAKAIIAVMRFELPNTDGGLIQLVNTADVKPARWVHGLASLNVMSLAQNK